MDVDFQTAYEELLERQLKSASAGRATRIRGGLGHAETTFLRQVWWPAFQHFEGLYPEYEIRDYTDAARFIDFAWLDSGIKLAIEIDGFETHWKNISNRQFNDQWRRQNQLILDDWTILRFGYGDVEHHPRYCQQTIRLLLAKRTNTPRDEWSGLGAVDREIARLALSLGRPVRLREVMERVSLAKNTAMRHLHALAQSGWLEPISGKTRITAYRIHPSRVHAYIEDAPPASRPDGAPPSRAAARRGQ